jgi:effector-binding domain-containing protein
MFEAAERQAARHACRAPRSPFLLFHDREYRDRHADIEVCVPFDPASPGACGGRDVAGVDRAACVRFSGSYDQARPLFRSIMGWIDGAGARPAGPVRETYLRYGADQRGYALPPRQVAKKVAQFRTELQVPIAEAEPSR